jgi:hypothetical protein
MFKANSPAPPLPLKCKQCKDRVSCLEEELAKEKKIREFYQKHLKELQTQTGSTEDTYQTYMDQYLNMRTMIADKNKQIS